MTNRTLQPILQSVAVVVFAALIAAAGADGGATVGIIPVFALCAAIAFAMQWVAFVPAYLRQTEHFYDLVGSLTHLSLVVCALVLSEAPDLRALLLTAMVAVWAIRLGTFLFRRIHEAGFDRRFTKVKPNPARFFMYWNTQGLWVFLTLAAALAAITSLDRQPLGWLGAMGIAVWLAGFTIEVVADRQKTAFRKKIRPNFLALGFGSEKDDGTGNDPGDNDADKNP